MKLRRWVLFGLWILSLVGISFYGGAVSYGFFFGVTLLPVVSFAYLLCIFFRFKIYQEIESRNIVCGQPVPYFFVLQNEDYFAFTSVSVRMYSSFSYVEEFPDGMEYELLPGDRFTHKTRLVCKYRGEYEVGVKEVVITDFFHLFMLRYRTPSAIKAVVLPKIVQLEELASIADFPILARREVYADTEPDIIVRDYVEGDSLKQIHWKATAREQKLKVRTRIGEEKQGIAIFCDTKRYGKSEKEYLPLENKILEVLLALGFFFAKREVEFTAYYNTGNMSFDGSKGSVLDKLYHRNHFVDSVSGNAQDSPHHIPNGVNQYHVQGMKDYHDFYSTVSGIVFRREEKSQETLAQMLTQGVLWGSRAVFCVLHELNDVIMEETERLAAEGSFVVIYIVTDEEEKDYVKQSSERRKIMVIPVEAELEGML